MRRVCSSEVEHWYSPAVGGSIPPTLSKNEINLSKETATQITENASETKASVSSAETIDKGKDKTKTETGFKWWQKMFVVIGVSSLIGLVIWVYLK